MWTWPVPYVIVQGFTAIRALPALALQHQDGHAACTRPSTRRAKRLVWAETRGGVAAGLPKASCAVETLLAGVQIGVHRIVELDRDTKIYARRKDVRKKGARETQDWINIMATTTASLAT